jgi:hypothetical protein
MSTLDEEKFHQDILITLIFNIRASFRVFITCIFVYTHNIDKS